MTRFYDLDAANAAVPELDGIMTRLVDQRAELVRLRDEVLGRGGTTEGAPAAVGNSLRLTRLRMQGLIDQMAAGVARIDAMGITLRDIEKGLVQLKTVAESKKK